MSSQSSPFSILVEGDRLTISRTQESSQVLSVDAQDVDTLCEQIYWARKSILQARNDAELALERQQADVAEKGNA